jgi:hypothetical protein
LEISKQHPTFFTKNYNVGVSVETPEQYYRIKDLQQVKGCTRWLSLAPFLAPMPDLPLEGIHHVVFTLEEGPGAKQFDDHAIDDVRRQCEAAGTGFRIQPLHRGMEFVKEEGKIGIGSVAMFPEAMIFQLIERTGGLQVIPLWNHPRAADWIKIRKSYHDFTNLEVADVVRKRAPEFFED